MAIGKIAVLVLAIRALTRLMLSFGARGRHLVALSVLAAFRIFATLAVFTACVAGAALTVFAALLFVAALRGLVL
jgi:hypothetical protein